MCKEQIERIKQKIHIANPLVKHAKTIGRPLPESKLIDFENKYQIKIPSSYRSFLLHICNGGIGPDYGLFTLEESEEYLFTDGEFLKEPCRLYPNITEEQIGEFFHHNDDHRLTVKEYDDQFNTAFHGLLPICSQGCSYFLAIIVRGEYSGKVVSLDSGYIAPGFFKEDNFLDWYENWLDEIIRIANHSS